MKKRIIVVITVIACVTLCAAVWPQNAKVGIFTRPEPVNNAVSAEIEAQKEEPPHILISADMPTLTTEPVTESNSPETDVTAKRETEKPTPAQTTQQVIALILPLPKRAWLSFFGAQRRSWILTSATIGQ